MKKYDKYKDCGIEWIGEIPEHWEVKKLKYIAKIKTGYTPSKNDAANYSDDGTIWVKPDILNQFVSITNSNEKISEQGIKRQNIIPKGSVLVCCIGSIGKFGVAGIDLVTNQQINSLIFKHYVISDFGKFIISASKFEHIKQANGNVVKILNTEGQSRIVFAIPSKPEQTAIANFLDRKTAEIDNLITQKEKLLKLYDEEKTAIINQAVTKGVPRKDGKSSVSFKDSGVEWLGQIPEHWEVKRVKHLCYVKGRVGWKGLKSSEFLQESYSYLVTGIDFKTSRINWKNCYQIDKERYEEDPYIQLKNYDLLITKDGTIGKLAIVEDLNKPACLNSGIFVVRSLLNSFSTEFLYWILFSNVFKKFNSYTSYGSTIQHLYQNVFIEFAFGVPNIEEQTAIVQHIETKTNKINTKITKTEKLIELLKEYKTALISEVVTGKIDVREEK